MAQDGAGEGRPPPFSWLTNKECLRGRGLLSWEKALGMAVQNSHTISWHKVLNALFL